jgi:hypothetical protein
MSKKTLGVFGRYWQGWEAKLSQLIKDSNGARLFFPPALSTDGPNNGIYTVRPIEPIFIYNAPTKASSHRRSRTSKKLAIFIDGSFEISEAEEHPCMHRAGCNVTFYTSVEKEDGSGSRLDFFDAMHFDFEFADKQTPYHPIFHVQRGSSRSVTDEKVKELYLKHLHITDEQLTITNRGEEALGTPYLRLPTPQLDMFSVITIIMADFFCNGGDTSNNNQIRSRFETILNYLRDESNVVREGHGSKLLRSRIAEEGTHMSMAYWYAECA